MYNGFPQTEGTESQYTNFAEEKWAAYLEKMNLEFEYRKNTLKVPISDCGNILTLGEVNSGVTPSRFKKYTPSFYVPNCFGSLEEAWLDIVCEEDGCTFEHKFEYMLNAVGDGESRLVIQGQPSTGECFVVGYYHLTDSIYTMKDPGVFKIETKNNNRGLLIDVKNNIIVPC